MVSGGAAVLFSAHQDLHVASDMSGLWGDSRQRDYSTDDPTMDVPGKVAREGGQGDAGRAGKVAREGREKLVPCGVK